MASSIEVIQSVRGILVADSILKSYIKERVYFKMPLKADIDVPMVMMGFDDDFTDSRNIPSGNYSFTLEIFESINAAKPVENIMKVKDRIKQLLNKQTSILNVQGYTTKFRTFDLVSAVLGDEYIGTFKMWCLPCIFNCVIDD